MNTITVKQGSCINASFPQPSKVEVPILVFREREGSVLVQAADGPNGLDYFWRKSRTSFSKKNAKIYESHTKCMVKRQIRNEKKQDSRRSKLNFVTRFYLQVLLCANSEYFRFRIRLLQKL
jgi:hypothetical protein